MLFKNTTTEPIKYRLGDYNTGFSWFTIHVDEVHDLPVHVGERLGLKEHVIVTDAGTKKSDTKKPTKKKLAKKSLFGKKK